MMTGSLTCPSITHGGKSPVSNPPFWIMPLSQTFPLYRVSPEKAALGLPFGAVIAPVANTRRQLPEKM